MKCVDIRVAGAEEKPSGLSPHGGRLLEDLAKYGALEFRECVGDDLKTTKVESFPGLVKPKRGETIVFSWIIYKSKADRDRINDKVMKDPRIARMMKGKKMPFDSKRMTYGGFKVMVDAS